MLSRAKRLLRESYRSKHFNQEVRLLQRWFNDQCQLLRDKHSDTTTYFICCGATGAGKSTLLCQSRNDIQAVLNEETPLPPGKTWVSEHTAFMELPAFFETDNHLAPQWFSALKQIFSKQYTRKFKGIICTIDISELFETDQRVQTIRQLQNQLDTIRCALGKKLPLFIVFNKMDLLQGFEAYFSHLSEEERQQAWGYEMPSAFKLQQRSFKDTFTTQFKNLINALHQNTIEYLQHERGEINRMYIHDFPLQMESLKSILFETLNALNIIQRQTLIGYFFTSVMQVGLPIDRLRTPLDNPLNLPSALDNFSNDVNISYFTHQLFHLGIYRTHISQTRQSTQFKRRVSSVVGGTALAGVIAGCTLALCLQLRHDVIAINHAQTLLSEVKSNVPNEIYDHEQLATIVDNISRFKVAAESLAPAIHTKWFTLPAFSKKQVLSQELGELYHSTLQQQLLPYLLSRTHYILQHIDANHYPQQYQALKAYIMLNDPRLIDIDFLSNYLQTHLDLSSLNPRQKAVLSQHINDLLKQHLATQNIDFALIKQSRQTLISLPQPLLALAILQASLENRANSHITLPSLTPFSQDTANVPSLYSKQYLPLVINQLLPSASNASLMGNFVLGRMTHKAVSPQTLQQGLEATTNYYLSNYINWWQAALSREKLPPIQNLHELNQVLSYLSDQYTQPLLQLLKIISENTYISDQKINNPLVVNKINQAFHALNEFSRSGHDGSAAQFNQRLSSLAKLTQQIERASDSNSAALQVITAYIQQPQTHALTQIQTLAAQLPSPLDHLANNIAQITASLLMQSAKQHMQTQWQQTIMPFYQAHIAKRYPIDIQSSEDIRLADFNKFFGNKGLLDTFFTQNIAPFINAQELPWIPYQFAGQQLPLDQNTIKSFERGNLIKAMYFPDDSHSPLVAFTLMPTAMVNGIDGLDLQVNGKIFHDTLHSAHRHLIVWPSDGPLTKTQIIFKHQDNAASSISSEGPWAIFKLIDQAHMTSQTDPKQYQLLFDKNGKAARYKLEAKAAINPFMAGIIHQFSLQPELFERG